MNLKMIMYTIGKMLKLEAILLIPPLIVSFIYRENLYLSFIIPIIILLVTGFALTFKKPQKKDFYAKEGFLIVGLSWIIMSLFGLLPYVISKEIPNFFNALFETISGFTTTGASILDGDEIEGLSKSIHFWRVETNWIGGMGILVFVIAIMPSTQARDMFIMKAESPGPQVGKIVSKLKISAIILYLIYGALTLLEIIFLLISKMPLFDSIVTSLATAGTGGFGIKALSMGGYNYFSQIIISIFMMLFGINFNFYYLILAKNVKQALKCEEVFWYFGIIIIATLSIAFNLYYYTKESFGIILKDSFFQVSSIITTTGFSSVDFNLWPNFSKSLLVMLMFVGACAGSTGGGIKVSRIVLLFKSIKGEFKRLIHPKSISTIRFEGDVVSGEVVRGVKNYFALMMIICAITFLLVSLDNNFSFTTNFTAVVSCLNNIGPGLDLVGPSGGYSMYSSFSKMILGFSMLIGRLEIYPILMLFSAKIWTNK